MKRVILLVGLGAGFVAGSRAGRRPYDRLEAKVRSLASRPEVHQTVVQAKDAARQRTQQVAGKVSDSVSTGGEEPSVLHLTEP
jgi:hypothetical protein